MVEELARGVAIGGFEVYAGRVARGRFAEESNIDIYLRHGRHTGFLLFVKVFYGRRPYYRPWMELFGINRKVTLGDRIVEYFGSLLEEELLKFLSERIPPGGRIFVEYYEDGETSRQLMAGFPPPVTRLGYILFRLGFTWFKDWYFPEGFMEGGQKLQGEKPIDEGTRIRQLRRIRHQVEGFLRGVEGEARAWYAARAVERAKIILRELEGETRSCHPQA